MATARGAAISERTPSRGENAPRSRRRWSDAALVAAARCGGSWAKQVLFRRHWGRCYRFARGVLGQDTDLHDELADVVQESMRVALERFDSLREPRHFSLWLSQLVLSTAHRALRRRRLRERIGELQVETVELDELPSPAADPFAVLEASRVVESLARLPERDRTIILLRRLDAETVPDIAKVLCASESSVKRWLIRGDRALGRTIEVHRASTAPDEASVLESEK